MKLLTLNTHGLQETDYENKLESFLELLLQERPEIIALQEVCQSCSAAPARYSSGMTELPEHIAVPLRQDNHVLRIALGLEARGVSCSWVWLPVKRGYDRYDEGLALLSVGAKICAVDVCTLSRRNDYMDWRTRRALGVQLAGRQEWFYCVHMGWWEDALEPFEEQRRRLDEHLSEKRAKGSVWLLGDFNAPAEIRGQGYDQMESQGWQDAWKLGRGEGAGYTVRGNIDGWNGQMQGMRIDHIWCSRAAEVESCRVVFDGSRERTVSDHFGVLAVTEEASG